MSYVKMVLERMREGMTPDEAYESVLRHRLEQSARSVSDVPPEALDSTKEQLGQLQLLAGCECCDDEREDAA